MTTSLAALAATSSSAQTGSGVSVSTNTTNSPSPVLDITDTNYEIKAEFYTREGLWKLVPTLELARQLHNISLNSSLPNSSQSYNNTQCGQNNQPLSGQNNNDPVKLNTFTFKKSVVFKDFFLNSKSNRRQLCHRCSSTKKPHRLNKLAESDSDEDNSDVIFNNIGDNSSETQTDSDSEKACRQCKTHLSRNDSESSTDSFRKYSKSNDQILELMLFNYGREIYTYETGSSNFKTELKNLIDKKTYKSVMSTCFDINRVATICNTALLQLNKTININLSSSDFEKMSFSTTLSQLSLIVAAGFNKGEIHVFDWFKKEASVFYNNQESKIKRNGNKRSKKSLRLLSARKLEHVQCFSSHLSTSTEKIALQGSVTFHSKKLVDKTKVTCIKWLPDSLNLFLVSYSSGNIYLYDANIQNQPNVAPVFSKIYQNESFSVFTNNSSQPSSTVTQPSSSNTEVNTSSTSSLASQSYQNKKLVLSNSNQQQSQTSKNPLLKLNIGPDPNHSNCINEFEFSPCGKYLAIVSQDGYLRVFSFLYTNNQDMQFQLKCSMKSYFGGLLCVSWSPDGRLIATGGEDDMITVFNFKEMKVACRGRGHSSWINCVAFDPWAKMSSLSFFTELNEESDDDVSEVEDENTKLQEMEKNLEKLEIQRRAKITAPKKRTISTLSDFNTHSFTQNATIFYRLGSVGQDNQICFWDITEDVLKEKPSNRSRITSFIQQSQCKISVQPTNYSNHSDGSVKEKNASIVTTARNLFLAKSAQGDRISENEEQTSTPKSSTLTGSFFRRHKRNSSNNSTSSQNMVTTETKHKNGKNTPVLNSYKKSSVLFSNLNPADNSVSSNQTSNAEYSFNSINSKKSPNSAVNSPFNLCPKLDEVPLMEPLICKRISNERLTSLVFRRDCFLVASQDGFVNTWSRPGKSANSNRCSKVLDEATSTCL